MKKEMMIFAVFFALALILCSGLVLAHPKCQRTDQMRIKMIAVDSDYDLVSSGAYGWVMLTKGERARAFGFDLKPQEDYALVFYNPINNRARCINYKQATRNGNVKINQFKFDYSCYLNDEFEEYFLIMPLKDVDCSKHEITDFHIKATLFPEDSI